MTFNTAYSQYYQNQLNRKSDFYLYIIKQRNCTRSEKCFTKLVTLKIADTNMTLHQY